MLQSGTTLQTFNPELIPYQWEVTNLVRDEWDYSKGNLEILLSGSYGCLRGDALVETIDGPIPISRITSQNYLLTFDEKSGRFVFQRGSDAYPKAKGSLFRVISERGEFVASSHHLVATYPYTYRQVSNLQVGDSLLSGSYDQYEKYPSDDQKWSLSDVLSSFGTVSSLIQNYGERIRQYDPQLLPYLKSVLSHFPLLNDAQAHGLFFCMNKRESKDALLELGTRLARIFESPGQIYKIHSALREGRLALAWEDQDFSPKPFEHTFSSTLRSMLFLSQVDHPKVLLLNLYRICASLNLLFVDRTLPEVPLISKVLKIEQVKDDWYWDIQVPNTNNYVSGGVVHHNSAKSIEMAHLAITHCMNNPKAVAMLARKAMPDLKATIFKECLDHLDESDNPEVKRPLIEGKDYWVNNSGSPSITFSNGSRIETISWADKKYKKGRSRKISFLIFEELTENNQDDREAFMTLKARLRRLPHVKENVLIAATNPDAPSHWAYKYFFEEKAPTKFVFKSVTTDNPFLDPIYIEQLIRDLDPRAIQRYIYGEWIELQKDQVYYNYTQETNFRQGFQFQKGETLILTHDFNIGANKPMSAAAMSKRGEVYHAFKAFHVEGARTLDIMEEIASSGLLDEAGLILVYGDATGKSNDTRSIKTDYDIIRSFLSNYKTKDGRQLRFELRVPSANPPIRRRQNLVNAYCKNGLGETRFYCYDKWIDEGLRLTAFKKGADMIEDDSLPQQHVTTAIGYCFDYDKNKVTPPSQTIRL